MTALFLASCVLAVLFALLSIKTADSLRGYFAKRARDKFDQHKRDHDYIVKAFSNILRESAMRGRK